MRLSITSEKHGIDLSYSLPADKVGSVGHAKVMRHLASLAQTADESVDELCKAYLDAMTKSGKFQLFEMASPGFTAALAKSAALEQAGEILNNAIANIGLDK